MIIKRENALGNMKLTHNLFSYTDYYSMFSQGGIPSIVDKSRLYTLLHFRLALDITLMIPLDVENSQGGGIKQINQSK